MLRTSNTATRWLATPLSYSREDAGWIVDHIKVLHKTITQLTGDKNAELWEECSANVSIWSKTAALQRAVNRTNSNKSLMEFPTAFPHFITFLQSCTFQTSCQSPPHELNAVTHSTFLTLMPLSVCSYITSHLISTHFATVTLKVTQCRQAVANLNKLALFMATKYARNTEIKIYSISKTVQTGDWGSCQ